MRNKEKDVENRKNKTSKEQVKFLEKILYEDDEKARQEMRMVYQYAFRK